MKTIVIDPVTRIEGYAKITIKLDDDDRVEETHFHVTQVRGFEKSVSYQHIGGEALFLEQLAHQFHGCSLVAPSLHQEIENLAFIGLPERAERRLADHPPELVEVGEILLASLALGDSGEDAQRLVQPDPAGRALGR